MSYPVMRVHTARIEENGRALIKECAAHGVLLWGVTKGMSAAPEIAAAYKRAGFEVLADSRMANIKKMRAAGIESKYALIRIPMPSELEDAVRYCDYSLVSESESILEMSRVCASLGKEHGVIIMIDMGDLREGFWPTELDALAEKLRDVSPYLKIAGVGSNFGCASGVLPSRENLTLLIQYRDELERKLGVSIPIVSGGGTCTMAQLMKGNVPPEVNSLRLGESVLLGTDTTINYHFPMLRQDTMEVVAELSEVRVKPTVPIGKIGMDFSGDVPVFEDRGDRLRGVLAIGRQDIRIEGLKPMEEGVTIITASSDHMLVDLEDCPVKYKAGDKLSFRMDYPGMLAASTSPYVEKIYD